MFVCCMRKIAYVLLKTKKNILTRMEKCHQKQVNFM